MERESQNQTLKNRASASDSVEEQAIGKTLTPPALSFSADAPPADDSTDPSSENPIQPSLQVGGANDIFEREANTVAAQVVGGHSSMPPISRIPAGFSAPTQRKTQQQGPTSLTSQLSASKSGGQNLDQGVRQEMESSFGYDFGQVRVHTGTQAAQMSSAIGAHAFTQGNHIYFNQNNYQTDNTAGKQLLAHELTHVVQQGAAQQKPANNQSQNALLGQRKTVDVNQRDNSNKLRRCGGCNGGSAPAFAPKVGTTTTELENSFGKFSVKHGLNGLPGGANGWGTYLFEVEMEAKETTGESKIGFVQTVRRASTPGDWATKATDPGMNEDRARRATDDGWRIDSWDQPFYGTQKRGGDYVAADNVDLSYGGMGDSEPITKFGKHGGANAYLLDIPAVVDPTAMEFSTTPMDMDTGTQFGSIAWGYVYNSSASTWNEETPRLLSATDSRAQGRDEAMKKWNDDVAVPGSGSGQIPGVA